ncbi:MAG: class I SAM-dependent methyltransferase [Paracoccaceae bacterium]
MSDNAEAGDFWSGPAGAKWIEHEEEQDRFLSLVAEAVIEAADLKPGERVLDIGCGAGALSLAAAQRVGPQGMVLATDIAPPFIDHVQRRAAALPQITTHLGDAQTTVWPSTGLDLAVSRFGVMFFSDPAKAFANIAKALRPGGRMVFAAWGRTQDNPYWRIARNMVADRYGPAPAPAPNSPGPMGLAETDLALAAFDAAGLQEVRVDTRTIALLHDQGAAGVASLGLRIGPAARALAEADATEAEVDAFRADAAEAFAPYEDGGIARVPATVHLYSARVA